MAPPADSPAPVRRGLLLAAAGGAAFAALEVGGALALAHPLDPRPTAGVAAATVALVVVLAGLLHLGGLRGARAAALALGVLALGWAPDALRPHGVPGGDLLGVGVGLGVLVVAWRRPRAGLVLGVLGGLAVPLARPAPVDGAARSAEPSGEADRPDVLLITVDTVRGDAALLPPGAWQRYELAVAPSPWTLPSMYSLMTGLPVREHGGGLPTVQGTGFSRPLDGLAWLPERFADAGYRTRAVVSNPHLRASEGFAAGFARFLHHDDARDPQRLAAWTDQWRRAATGAVSRVARTRDARVTDQALAWLGEDAPGPALLWVHLLLPHEYGRDAAAPPAGWTPGTDDLAVLRAAYAGNVAATRARLDALVAAAGPDTVVAVVSDHGEALGEGGRLGHGKTLDDVELHVPLALRGPGVEAGSRDGPVAVHDLGATLLSLAGLAGLPGRDLRTGAAGPVEVGGVRRDGTAFARRTVTGAYERRPPGVVGEAGTLDAEQLRALEALGYVDAP